MQVQMFLGAAVGSPAVASGSSRRRKGFVQEVDFILLFGGILNAEVPAIYVSAVGFSGGIVIGTAEPPLPVLQNLVSSAPSAAVFVGGAASFFGCFSLLSVLERLLSRA